MNRTTTIPIAAGLLRRLWLARHSTSMPSFRQATSFVAHYDPSTIIDTLETVLSEPIPTSGDAENDACVVRHLVQKRLPDTVS